MTQFLRNAFWIGALAVSAPATAQESSFGAFPSKSAQTRSAKEEAAVGSGATAPKQIATRLSTFGIPIASRERTDGIKEIQLHVSADRGKTWRLYYRVGPKDQFFPFKAAADGEYWFATRLVDSALRTLPEGDLRPEMKVLIDTTPPRLMLTSELTPSGEVVANWQATDPLLSTQSLKLEYQTSPTGQWRSIAIPHAGLQNQNGVLSGKVSWFPREASGGYINLRAEILDQAGNHSVALDRLGQGAIARGVKPLEPPIAGPVTPPQQDAVKSEGTLSAVSKWFGGALGSASKSQAPPEDPLASSIPSDTASNGEPRSSSTSPVPPKSTSQWTGSNTELTDSGIRRIPPTHADQPAVVARESSDGTARPRSERRGPGRLASAATVREPKRPIDYQENDENFSDEPLPSIQAPANSNRNQPASQGNASQEDPLASEPEEIPPPRAEPRLAPAEPREETLESPSTAYPNEEAEASPADRASAPRAAVESLSREGSRQPIPSAPRKKPSEFRIRSPIASGLKGDEMGVARPPATPTYRNASAARDVIQSTAESGRLPAGAEPIYSNQLRFGLEYDVNMVGSGGVSEVELWATRDGGQNWSRWGSDPDRRSPFDVEVDGEGVFGFRIVVLSRGGLASRPPQPGDEADQWIVVDTTQPRLALRGAGYGSEERAGQLEISWDAQDANLTEKSVSLYYSDQEEGPWTRIVSDLSNQGEYFWRVDSRIPPRIYIKVEVRDGSGNVASDQTREAIKVEGLIPSGKIRRIIPRHDDKE